MQGVLPPKTSTAIMLLGMKKTRVVKFKFWKNIQISKELTNTNLSRFYQLLANGIKYGNDRMGRAKCLSFSTTTKWNKDNR